MAESILANYCRYCAEPRGWNHMGRGNCHLHWCCRDTSGVALALGSRFGATGWEDDEDVEEEGGDGDWGHCSRKKT